MNSARLRKKLLSWYAKEGRELPWRETSDPYAIWVSEIMLQQTQVATVLPYFARFLDAFPDVRSLANASESDVFRYWEGLGYYRRARLMHQAAKVIVENHGGQFPMDFQQVLDLPGIGRYTAGAICSFAYDASHPIVEANTQRLYARLLALDGDLSTNENQSKLWGFAEQMIPATGCGPFNHALMDLGAMVCRPKQPDCSACPLRKECSAFAKGLQSEIPTPKRPKNYEDRTELVVLLAYHSSKSEHPKKWLIRKCGAEERWAGLWDFPRFDVTDCHSETEVQQAVEKTCREWFGRGCQLGTKLKTLRHAVTRYRITLHCHEARWESGSRFRNLGQEIAWVTREELSNYALSSTGRKICGLIRS